MTSRRYRPRLLLLGLALAFVVGAIAGAQTGYFGARDDTAGRTVEDVRMVHVVENGSDRLWPYTSRGENFDQATLPINVVVRTDAATVRRLLAAGADGTNSQWEATSPENETVVFNGTDVQWSTSHGADRYTYVETDGNGRWIDETYQVHDGTYFGTRHHLRLYEGGQGADRWTAIQAHHEHWDWFRLRHTVGSLDRAQRHVEQDFYGTRYLAGISRQRYANGGALDADGWVTVIDVVDWTTNPTAYVAPLALGAVVAAASNALSREWRRLREFASESRLSPYHVALLSATAAFPLAVRAAGVALETATPLGDSPKVIAALLFPVLALGLPVTAAKLGDRLSSVDGFASASLGLGAGLVLDYGFLQIAAVPIHVIVHRFVLLVALGLVAAGGTRWAEELSGRYRYRAIGVSLWVGALLWTLLGL